MAHVNKNKLQALRNFPSIWHNVPQNISKNLKQDYIIRKYILGTLRAKQWRISEIIIKRRIKSFHFILQIQYKKTIKKKILRTKNRLKNQIKYLEKMKKLRKKQALLRAFQKRRQEKLKQPYPKYVLKKSLYFQIFLIITRLRKMYPDNFITFYVQRVKVRQLNTNFLKTWIHSQLDKNKSFKRIIIRALSFYRQSREKLNLSFLGSEFNYFTWEQEEQLIFISWFTTNLLYLYQTTPSTHSFNSNKNFMPYIHLFLPPTHHAFIRWWWWGWKYFDPSTWWARWNFFYRKSQWNKWNSYKYFARRNNGSQNIAGQYLSKKIRKRKRSNLRKIDNIKIRIRNRKKARFWARQNTFRQHSMKERTPSSVNTYSKSISPDRIFKARYNKSPVGVVSKKKRQYQSLKINLRNTRKLKNNFYLRKIKNVRKIRKTRKLKNIFNLRKIKNVRKTRNVRKIENIKKTSNLRKTKNVKKLEI